MGRHSAPEEPQDFQSQGFDPRNYTWSHETPDPDAAFGSGPAPGSHPLPVERPASSSHDPDDDGNFGYSDPAFHNGPTYTGSGAENRSWYDQDSTDEHAVVPPLPRGRRPAESRYDDDDDDILQEMRRRRPAAEDDPDADIDLPVDEGDGATGAGREKRPNRKFRAVAGTLGAAALIVCIANFSHDVDDNKNNFSSDKPMATSGPNRLPQNPIEGEQMDTPEDRMAYVQRMVNNGDNGKTVDVLPGTLTLSDNGETTKVKNPIVVMEGLGDKYDKLASSSVDPAFFDGYIYGIEPSTYDPTEGVGESYKVIPVDAGNIVSWKPATNTKGKMPVEAKVGWHEDDAAQAIDPDTDKPFRQGKNNGPIIDSEKTKGTPMVIGEVQE